MITKEAGAVVYRLADSEPEILLRREGSAAGWGFPKTSVEKSETGSDAAARCTGLARENVRVLGEAGDLLRFSSFVRVRYYLIEGLASEAGAGRAWFPAAAAVSQLTDDGERRLLKCVLPDIDEEKRLSRAPTVGPEKDDQTTAFLLAEYEHTAESLLRNEEDGEKRAMFFMTLAGATGTALAFFLGKDAALGRDERYLLLTGGLSILMVVGYLTLLRIIQRNRASDGYKRALNRLRRHFVAKSDLRHVYLAFNPDRRERRVPPSWRSLGKGGWLETIALVDAIVAGTLFAAIGRWFRSDSAELWFATGAIVAWMLLMSDAARRYRAGDR